MSCATVKQSSNTPKNATRYEMEWNKAQGLHKVWNKMWWWGISCLPLGLVVQEDLVHPVKPNIQQTDDKLIQIWLNNLSSPKSFPSNVDFERLVK